MSEEREFEIVSWPSSSLSPAQSSSHMSFPLGEVSIPRVDFNDEELSALCTFRSSPLTLLAFNAMLDSSGRIIDEIRLLKAIFQGGAESSARPDVWRFLFGMFDFHSTYKERQAHSAKLSARYNALKERWKAILLAAHPNFDLAQCDNCIMDSETGPSYVIDPPPVQSKKKPGISGFNSYAIEAKTFALRCRTPESFIYESLRYVAKDVPRTERSVPLFAGDNCEGLLAIRDLLVTFTFYRSDMGYVQGMNDIMARFYSVFMNEADAFWCFDYYLNRTGADFRASGMVSKIGRLKSLLRELDPDLYSYLAVCDGADLIYCHKWLLLSFLREFNFEEGLKLFEILNTQHLELDSHQAKMARQLACRELTGTDHTGVAGGGDSALPTDLTFDLFVCVGILNLHRNRLFQCQEGSQVFRYVTDLSGQLSLADVLPRAEKLFYQYCRRSLLDCFAI